MDQLLLCYQYVEVGAKGDAGDAEMFLYSTLMKDLDSISSKLPPPEPLKMDMINTPYCMVADAAFVLLMWMQKPYPRVNAPQKAILAKFLSKNSKHFQKLPFF